MLEVDAGADFPRQFVGAVHLENISGVEVEIVIVAVDVVVGIGEIVASSLVGESAAVDAFLALNGESGEDLPFVRQPLDGGEFNGRDKRCR